MNEQEQQEYRQRICEEIYERVKPAIDRLNSDPKALETWIKRGIEHREERKREGRSFVYKYLRAMKIHEALLANPQGLTMAEMRDLFPSKNDPGLDDRLRVALNILKERGIAERVGERWIARPSK